MFNYLHKILVSYFKVIEQLCRTISEVMNCFSSPSDVYISDEAKTKRYVQVMIIISYHSTILMHKIINHMFKKCM